MRGRGEREAGSSWPDDTLAIATGPGAEMRQSPGTAVFSGMLGVTLFGLFLTPVFHVALRRLFPARAGHAAPVGRRGCPEIAANSCEGWRTAPCRARRPAPGSLLADEKADGRCELRWAACCWPW